MGKFGEWCLMKACNRYDAMDGIINKQFPQKIAEVENKFLKFGKPAMGGRISK